VKSYIIRFQRGDSSIELVGEFEHEDIVRVLMECMSFVGMEGKSLVGRKSK